MLELDVDKLQAELQESYELIDELEFDVEQVTFVWMLQLVTYTYLYEHWTNT